MSATTIEPKLLKKTTLPPSTKPAAGGGSNTAVPVVAGEGMLGHISDNSWQSFAGVAFSLVGSFCFVAGWQVMHNANLEKTGETPVNKKRWYFGVCLNILAGVLDALALSLTAQSIINALGGISLVLNALIVPCWNIEELKNLKKSGFAAIHGGLIVFVGATMCVLAGDHSPTAYSTRELELFFSESSFVIFELTTLAILAYFLAMFRVYPHVRRKEVTILFMLGYTPAWLGAIMNLTMKAVMEIIKSSFKGESSFFSIDTFLAIVVTILLAVAQILFVNRGLETFKHRTVKFIGFYQAIMMVLGCTTGGIFYSEFDHFTLWQWIFFITGALTAIWGMLVIAFLGEPREHDVDMPSKKYCCCHSHLICGIVDTIMLEDKAAVGKHEPVRARGYLDKYDDGL